MAELPYTERTHSGRPSLYGLLEQSMQSCSHTGWCMPWFKLCLPRQKDVSQPHCQEVEEIICFFPEGWFQCSFPYSTISHHISSAGSWPWRSLICPQYHQCHLLQPHKLGHKWGLPCCLARSLVATSRPKQADSRWFPCWPLVTFPALFQSSQLLFHR